MKSSFILAVLFFFGTDNLFCQSEIPPVTTILSPIWTSTLPSVGGKATIPIVYDNIIIPPTPGFFYYCKSGLSFSSENATLQKSVAFTYEKRARNYVEIGNYNPYTIAVEEKGAGTNDLFNVSPVLINDDYCFFNNGQIFKYSSTSRTSTILAHEGLMPESRIYSSSQEIHYTNDKTLVARSKNDGSIIRALALPAKASGIYVEDQHVFIWIPDRGVQFYQTINYQLLWEYKIEDAHIANMHFEVEDDCLYFSANDVYCLDIPSGQLKWKTEGNCSRYPFYTRVIDGYLIHYNSCFKEGEIPALIEILDAQSGEVKYRGWTSDIYLADDYWGISEMDMQGYFSFAQNSCGDILVGLRQNILQGFSLKQK